MTKVLRYSAALLFVTALSLLVGGSAAAQSTNNPRYRQFRDTAAASITTPAAGNVRLFFDSTGFYWKNSAGVSTAVGGTLSGLTTGVVPQAGSATTIVDSKMTTSGGSSGTWTLYDNGVTGVTSLVVRAGANGNAWPTKLVDIRDSSNVSMGGFVANGGTLSVWTDDLRTTAGDYFILNGSAYGGLYLNSTFTVEWSSAGASPAGDIGLARSAAGILAITDGSTGYGMLRASRLGVGTAPVTADGLNITATTGMTSNLRLVGTSGIINPVITFVDVGPTTGSITWQSPAMELRGGSGHYMSLKLSSTPAILFGDNANDAGIEWVEGSTLKVTDGSTGQGGIGIADSATNTVSDALILRHQGGTVTTSFGTGLLFQGEDAAGNMQDMASIDAVYTDATNGSEDAELWLNTFAAGADGAALVVSRDAIRGDSLYLRAADGAAGHLYFQTGSTTRWQIVGNSAGTLIPFATNTYSIGASTNLVKDFYLSTSIQGTRTQAISDNAAAATFVTIAVPTSDTTVGGRIFYTITAIDAGTDIQTKTGTYSFGLNNIGGTVAGAGTDVLEHSQLSSGTLAPTFSVNISGTNAQFQLVLDTSLDAAAETLKIEYRVQIDSGTATVTPAT